MAGPIEYTALAHRYTARFPVTTYVATQTNFWVAANILLITVMYLSGQIFRQAFSVPFVIRFGDLVLIAISLGVPYGVSMGLSGYYLNKTIFRKLSLGKMILCKAVMAVVYSYFFYCSCGLFCLIF